jgi:hypothetical protein
MAFVTDAEHSQVQEAATALAVRRFRQTAETLPLIDRLCLTIENPSFHNQFKTKFTARTPKILTWTDEGLEKEQFHEASQSLTDRRKYRYRQFKWRDWKDPLGMTSFIDAAFGLGEDFSEGFVDSSLTLPRDLTTKAWNKRPFFDAQNVHPDKSKFSNVIELPVADPDNLTEQDRLRAILAIKARLIENGAIGRAAVQGAELDKNVMLMVHDSDHYQGFEQLRTVRTLTQGGDNPLTGSFDLWYDLDPNGVIKDANRNRFVEGYWVGQQPAKITIGRGGNTNLVSLDGRLLRPFILFLTELPKQANIPREDVHKETFHMLLESWYEFYPAWPELGVLLKFVPAGG